MSEGGRINVQVELAEGANAIIERARHRLGQKKKELVARIIQAFVDLPPEVQDLILRPLDDPRRSRIAVELLRSLAGEQAEDSEEARAAADLLRGIEIAVQNSIEKAFADEAAKQAKKKRTG